MTMVHDLFAPLVALGGVILSVLFSYLASKRSIDNELRKLRIEAQRAYDSKVLESRISTYPQLYFLLSDLAKTTRRSGFSNDMLEAFIAKVDDWDSRNSLFMSLHTASTCYEFRAFIRQVIPTLVAELAKVDRNFLDRIGMLEFALKSDLGICGVKGAQTPELKFFRSKSDYWEELTRVMGRTYSRTTDRIENPGMHSNDSKAGSTD